MPRLRSGPLFFSCAGITYTLRSEREKCPPWMHGPDYQPIQDNRLVSCNRCGQPHGLKYAVRLVRAADKSSLAFTYWAGATAGYIEPSPDAILKSLRAALQYPASPLAKRAAVFFTPEEITYLSGDKDAKEGYEAHNAVL